LLLDDELPGLSYLKMLCEQLPELEVVKAFNNPLTFLEEVPGLDFDLCILDIEMPEMNGLQVAELLTGKAIIFTTAYKEYAAEAFDLNAIDYVRKPVKRERLQQAVQKVKERLQSQAVPPKKFVQLNTDKGKALVYFEQIGYIETSAIDPRDKTLHLTDGNLLTIKNLSFEKIMESLPPADFCRINKKEVLALKQVQAFSFDEITTKLKNREGSTIRLSLSSVYRSEFIQKVNF
jgi:DNA-binding LytR/AlgR family response regulator